MRYCQIILFSFLLLLSATIGAQNILDNFEGNGNISTWAADAVNMNTSWANPVARGINNSATVLRYFDYGSLYGNIRFDAGRKLNIAAHPEFSFKIFVPSSSITGNQRNQVALKLQNSTANLSWRSQSVIVKPIILDQWQVVTFNFMTDPYVNFDPNSPAPVARTDFDRILIQVNGEDNTDEVVAYIDDFFHLNNTPVPSSGVVYDQLVWSDEFNGNGALDRSKWFHQTQFPVGDSWFSGEIQHYTNRLANSYMQNGSLHLVARKESFTDQGVTKQYTSARLNAKFAFTYGRVEFRAKLPSGVGTWPAIWMLGKNIDERGAYWQTQGFGTVSWPYCGEIDIMEHWGADQNNVTSAIHTPSTYLGGNGGTINSGGQFVPTASTDFHIYALEWSADKIEFSVDGAVHYTYQPAVKNTYNWPFSTEQYLLLNVAMLPSVDPGFTQSTMEVDYIRIYKESSVGISEINRNVKIRAFPNPVVDQISLELNNDSNGRAMFKVYDISGALVYSREAVVENGNAQLKGLDALPKGLYIITYIKDGLSGTVKFIK
jgi:beta-glucanase (GH16 family)